MGYEVILSHGAEKDLDEIVQFISEDKPDVAVRMAMEIISHFRRLENFPRLGRGVPEFGEECLREIIHSPYRLIYEVNNQAERIEVIRVWHAARRKPELKPD